MFLCFALDSALDSSFIRAKISPTGPLFDKTARSSINLECLSSLDVLVPLSNDIS